jgi:hypothetical protein
VGLFSGWFGASKDEKALRAVFEKIRRVLEDEEFQIELLPPPLQSILRTCPGYDRDPRGTGPFGYSETNPIPVNGPIGELAYLSKLETENGERILFHRIGAIDKIDVFEAVTFSGTQWFILFADMYHPRRSRLLPEGFRFTKEVPQFSGFHKRCDAFPYDFAEMKNADQTGLSMAYIPISKIAPWLEKRAYQRSLAHKAKLELLNARITSFQNQS